MNIHRVDNLSFYLDQSIVLAVVQVLKNALFPITHQRSWISLGTRGTLITCITLLSSFTRGSLWGLWLQQDLHHPCTHVDPWVLEVHNFQVIQQHPLDPRVPGFPGHREFQEHISQSLHESNLLVWCAREDSKRINNNKKIVIYFLLETKAIT